MPPAADFHHRERLGATGWSPEAVRPYYQRVLERVALTSPTEGSPCSEAFIATAAALGFPHVDFRDWDGSNAVGWFWFNARGTTRMSSSVAYLHLRAPVPANLTIFFETVAYGLLIDGNGECRGVRASRGDFIASQETVLACRAFETPKLLLSGIGLAEHLRDLGIPVRLDLPGVGQNLVDHIEGIVIWEAARPIPRGATQYWEAGLFARLNAASP